MGNVNINNLNNTFQTIIRELEDSKPIKGQNYTNAERLLKGLGTFLEKGNMKKISEEKEDNKRNALMTKISNLPGIEGKILLGIGARD